MIVFTKDGNVDWDNSFDESEDEEPQFACPVCGKVTLSKRGNWEGCSNCGWIDDVGQCEDFPDETHCSNRMSLNEARAAYKAGKKVI